MTNRETSFHDPLTDNEVPSTITEKLSDTTAQVMDNVAGASRAAARKFDDGRAAAASGLEKAAASMHETADNLPGVRKVSGLAHATADKLATTANYVRDHDLSRMMADIGTIVKNNPGASLMAAVAVGFFVGRAFTSNHEGRG